MDISLPSMNEETLLYLNPNKGLYEWTINYLFGYVESQVEGVS